MILKANNISPNNFSLDKVNAINIVWKNNGDRQYAYRIYIKNNATDVTVYDSTKLTSFNTFHILSANTLTNGITYKIQILNYNQLDESSTSDWILFKCSSTPTTALTNLTSEATILNNSYTFEGSYTQAESIAIKSWQILLYDSVNSLISASPETFNSTISYEFSGLNNDTTYKVEIQVKSQDNLLGTTGKITFDVAYEVPKSAIALTATNNGNLGAVELNWNVTQIIGDGENYSFIDSEKVDVTEGNVFFDEGFIIPSNFTNEMWIEDVTNIDYNVNNPTTVVVDNGALADTTKIWLDNTYYTTPTTLGVVLSPVQPAITTNIWIEDSNQVVTQSLTSAIDITSPSLTTMWVDLTGGSNSDTELYTMTNNNGNIVSLRYYNDGFHLYENGVLIDSVSVTATKYYLYIQQIDGVLSLHAESND